MPSLVTVQTGERYFRVGEFEEWLPGKENLSLAASVAKRVASGLDKVELDLLPSVLTLANTNDLRKMFLTSNGFWIVHADVMGVIEGLDPGRHSFTPIAILNKFTRESPEGRWFLMQVFAQQKALIEELSDVSVSKATYRVRLNSDAKRITLHRNRDHSMHLWRERGYSRVFFTSDETVNALTELDAMPKTRGVVCEKQIEFSGG